MYTNEYWLKPWYPGEPGNRWYFKWMFILQNVVWTVSTQPHIHTHQVFFLSTISSPWWLQYTPLRNHGLVGDSYLGSTERGVFNHMNGAWAWDSRSTDHQRLEPTRHSTHPGSTSIASSEAIWIRDRDSSQRLTSQPGEFTMENHRGKIWK